MIIGHRGGILFSTIFSQLLAPVINLKAKLYVSPDLKKKINLDAENLV